MYALAATTTASLAYAALVGGLAGLAVWVGIALVALTGTLVLNGLAALVGRMAS